MVVLEATVVVVVVDFAVVVVAMLSPSQPANLQLSWAETALLSEFRGTYTRPTPYTHPTPTHPPGISGLDLFITYFCIVHDLFMTCS